MSTFLYFSAIILFLLLCVVLCIVILMQESKSSGLGASFGGDTSDSLFGTSTADVLRRFTGYLAAAFMVSCVVLSIWTQTIGRLSSLPSQSLQIEQDAGQYFEGE